MCFFFLCLFIKPASKRSRRMRRYVKIIPMNLQRAQMSTATAQRWTTMKTTVARRGPTFISIVCLLSDCEVQVLRFEPASLKACVTLKRFQKQQLHLHNQTLSSWGFFFYLFISIFFVLFCSFNLAFDSFCTVEWDHKNTYVKLLMIYLILYLYTEGPWWAKKPKQREH